MALARHAPCLAHAEKGSAIASYDTAFFYQQVSS